MSAYTSIICPHCFKMWQVGNYYDNETGTHNVDEDSVICPDCESEGIDVALLDYTVKKMKATVKQHKVNTAKLRKRFPKMGLNRVKQLIEQAGQLSKRTGKVMGIPVQTVLDLATDWVRSKQEEMWEREHDREMAKVMKEYEKVKF